MGMRYAFIRRSGAVLALDSNEEQYWYGMENQYPSYLQRLYDFCLMLWEDGVLEEEPTMDAELNVVWVGTDCIGHCDGRKLEFIQ